MCSYQPYTEVNANQKGYAAFKDQKWTQTWTWSTISLPLEQQGFPIQVHITKDWFSLYIERNFTRTRCS